MNFQITSAWAIALGILAIWDLVWRGLALWRASHLNNRNWFIVLLVINSIGILPIFYLYITRPVDQK